MYICIYVRMSIFVSMCALSSIYSSESRNRTNHGCSSLPFLTYHICYLSRDGNVILSLCRAFQKSAAESRLVNLKFQEYLRAGESERSGHVMMAMQEYYDAASIDQDAVDKALNDAVNDEYNSQSQPLDASSIPSMTSSELKLHLGNIESVNNSTSITGSVESLSSVVLADVNAPVNEGNSSGNVMDLEKKETDPVMIYSARSQADDETDELKQTMMNDLLRSESTGAAGGGSVSVTNGDDHDSNSASSNKVRGEQIKSLHNLVVNYNQSVATAVVCANVFKVCYETHSNCFYFTSLQMDALFIVIVFRIYLSIYLFTNPSKYLPICLSINCRHLYWSMTRICMT